MNIFTPPVRRSLLLLTLALCLAPSVRADRLTLSLRGLD